MKKLNFTGIFLILVLVGGAAMTFLALPQAVRENMPFDSAGWLDGANSKAIEKTYDESLPVTDPAIDAWNRAGFAVFGEGRKGVLAGTDGWLFSAEEFEKSDGFQDNINANLAYIASVRDTLAKQKIQLMVIALPSKARVYRAHLGRYEFPLHWQAQYDKMMAFMAQEKIPAVNVLSVFSKAPAQEELFLKTDTHWSPDGARRVAQAVAAQASSAFPYLSFDARAFRMIPGGEENYEGDLMRFIGKGAVPGLAPDTVRRFTLDVPEGDDLFGDAALPIVLVGTSYSANDAWGFANFLKTAFQADILNRSDEGKGPFEVMRDYLSSDIYKKSPPRLVLWEVPERYLPVHYELTSP